MDFSVNYYNNEYNKQYLFDEEIYLKYPGFSASLDEMVTMPKIKNKILTPLFKVTYSISKSSC